jgi:hypothetical protein
MRKLLTKFSALPALIIIMAICMNMTTPIQSGKIFSESKTAYNDYSVFMVEESWTWGTFWSDAGLGLVGGAVGGAAAGAVAGALCSPFGAGAGAGVGAVIGGVAGTVGAATVNVVTQAVQYFSSSSSSSSSGTSGSGSSGGRTQTSFIGAPPKLSYVSEVILD